MNVGMCIFNFLLICKQIGWALFIGEFDFSTIWEGNRDNIYREWDGWKVGPVDSTLTKTLIDSDWIDNSPNTLQADSLHSSANSLANQ